MTTSTVPNNARIDRSSLPRPLPPPDILLPEIRKTVLDNGLAVWFVEQRALPHVALNLVVNAGTDHDPSDLPGLAAFTAEMMDTGTGSMSALTIADRLDYIGAAISIQASLDATSAAMYTLTKHLNEALAVYSEIISAPAFPVDELERIRSQRLTMLLQQRDRPAYVANVTFNKILYGDHPYGSDPTGTESSLQAISRQNLQHFYQEHLRPRNSTLLIVGDASPSELAPMIGKAFEGWMPSGDPASMIKQAPATPSRKVYLVDKPGAPQSEIRIGCPALPRNTPDFFAVIVMNRILGGQFSSRINMNLRERHGYTYGAWTAFRFAKREGPFVAMGGFISDKTDSAIVELLSEIERMHAEGITEEELEFSKKGICGSFALNFETPLQIASALQNIVLYGLPDDYFHNYVRNIQRVTLDDVRRVAAKYLDAATMSVLVVGDVKTIRPGVEKLSLGETVLLDAQ